MNTETINPAAKHFSLYTNAYGTSCLYTAEKKRGLTKFIKSIGSQSSYMKDVTPDQLPTLRFSEVWNIYG